MGEVSDVSCHSPLSHSIWTLGGFTRRSFPNCSFFEIKGNLLEVMLNRTGDQR